MTPLEIAIEALKQIAEKDNGCICDAVWIAAGAIREIEREQALAPRT